ncbi:MAG: hypothetical protein Kow0081_2020 [Candidatus Dojkabacteria bacterium]
MRVYIIFYFVRVKEQNSNYTRKKTSSSKRTDSNNSRSNDSRSSKFINRRGGRNKATRNGRGSRSGQRNRARKQKVSGGIPLEKFENRLDHTLIEEQQYEPMNTFSDFNFHPQLQKNIEEKGYVQPSEIQDKTIPFISVGQDVLGIAQTGSGKTAAFLLPMINKVLKNKDERVLIVAPTRELALQINEEFKSFTKKLRIFSVVAIGGTSIRNQFYHLSKPHNFVIGTPGRIKDMVERKKINLWNYRNVVLDEVDKMLDMGFRDDIEFLISKMSDERQSLFFSATTNPEIDKLIKKFLAGDFISTVTKKRDTSELVDQQFVIVKKGESKLGKLVEILRQEDVNKILIFTRTKIRADKLAKELQKLRFKVNTIHGDKSQSSRKYALRGFKEDFVPILVATDVAARGIDISDVSHVINFDAPENYDDYIHRIGRTGRAGKIGHAITLIEENQINERGQVISAQAVRRRR